MAYDDHDRTTATTYINDRIVVCVLENILSGSEDVLVADGAREQVIDGRVGVSARDRGRVHRGDRATPPSAPGGVSERRTRPRPQSHRSCSSSTRRRWRRAAKTMRGDQSRRRRP
jgi:hypothetical protein